MLATLRAQDASRVPELVPIRLGRMSTSPFAFFRGAAAIMAGDLARTPSTGLVVQLCGDAHLSNFGFFAAPDRRLVFDLNDFDETAPGPWEWDLKRLAASFAVAARERGIGRSDRATVVREVASRYRTAMRELATMGHLDVWYARVDVEELRRLGRTQASKRQLRQFDANVAKARSKTSLRALGRLTEEVDGALRFRSAPPLLVRLADLVPADDARDGQATLGALLADYRCRLRCDADRLVARYRLVDVARKVVGVGSVGTRAWVILLLGRHPRDPLVLQVKEAEASVLEAHVGAVGFEEHGERVVEGQRLMQAASDPLLGSLRAVGIDGNERDFYVRQLWDGKGAALVETMRARELAVYGRLCGVTLARAHARSGDPAAIAAYLGKGDRFDRAMVAFAEAYADQNERDHRQLLAAIEDGEVEARAEL